VFRALIVEGELIRAAAVIRRSVAGKLLRVVDVPETCEVYAGAVDGGRKDDYILPGEEGVAVVGLRSGYGVVGDEDGRSSFAELRGEAEKYVVDERGRVAVLRLFICSRYEKPEAAFVKAG